MTDAIIPPPLPSTEESERSRSVGRAYIDAIGDAIQNIAALWFVHQWFMAGKIDANEAMLCGAAILGFVSVTSVLDRFTAKRVPRAPLSVLIAVCGAKVFAAGTAEAARRTLLVLAALVLPIASSCSLFTRENARTANDVARELCEIMLLEDAQRDGLNVRDICLLPHVLEPFLSAHKTARAAMERPQ